MIDVESTLAAIRVTLEAHNAMPVRASCTHCSQVTPGREPGICCEGCQAVTPTEAVRLELAKNGEWRVGVLQDPQRAGIARQPSGAWQCVACVAAGS